ncbi:hypothetical protein R1sor_017340 [Riccia sorocarpa]|uniref:TPM domain-containing protein n=1 Tax=Riccia sorocarpa TaxID=122646 RepID=A0ABD3I6J9_9MARC
MDLCTVFKLSWRLSWSSGNEVARVAAVTSAPESRDVHVSSRAAMATTSWAERLTAQPAGLRSSSLSGKPLLEVKPELSFPAARQFKKARAVVNAALTRDSIRVAASGLAAAGLSALLQFAPLAAPPALANEATILNFGPPQDGGYVLDDASVLNRVTRSELKDTLKELEDEKGYHINFITVRKLTSKADAFEFADSILEKWYPTIEQGNNKGIVLLVTTQKEGAVTGGPAFVKAVGDQILEAITTENLPVLATDEKYNEAFSSTAKRLVAVIKGQPDIPGPKFQESKRESNFKTKQETDEKRGQFSTVVGGLLVIAFVVPMAQYYAYVSKK